MLKKDMFYKGFLGIFTVLCLLMITVGNRGIVFAEEYGKTTENTEENRSETDKKEELSENETAALELCMTADQTEVKAGKNLRYELVLKNTGQVMLEQVVLESVFSEEGVTGCFQLDKGMNVPDHTHAVVFYLAPEEKRCVYLDVTVPENEQDPLEHTIYARAVPENQKEDEILREISLCTVVLPLTTDFQVEKSADCTAAFPGETVTYQIRIHNTGDRTLHSVLTTERFQKEGVTAKFLPEEGVSLNPDQTEAFYPQLLPGEELLLRSEVTLPWDFTEEKLLNQVLVVTDETSRTEKSAEAEILIQQQTETLSPSPTEQTAGSKNEPEVIHTEAVQTGDESRVYDWALLFLTIPLILFAVFAASDSALKRN